MTHYKTKIIVDFSVAAPGGPVVVFLIARDTCGNMTV